VENKQKGRKNKDLLKKAAVEKRAEKIIFF